MSKLKKAMEKAKVARNVVSPDFINDEEGLSAVLGHYAEKHAQVRKEISPTYSRTRIVDIDERVLEKNKIVSLFHEKAMTDQLKILRTQVLNRMKQLGANSLLVTSADPGVGKTLTAINLAVSISQEVDQTVLLVDADLRTPSIHRYFGLDISKGLADYLLHQAELPDLLLNPRIENLVVLPAGNGLPNSAELLGAPRMESLVKEIKGRYTDRFIIYDSPALLSCADPLVLSGFVDSLLLVVEAEKTSTKDIRQAFEVLREKTIIGTVFNKAKG